MKTIDNNIKKSWQIALSNLITNPIELAKIVKLDPKFLEQLGMTPEFPLRVTHSFAARIKKSDPKDPLLLQIFPQQKELLQVPGFTNDPLTEKNSNPIPGLLHKYQDRVLLTPTGACAIHCRYCFRRHFPYTENFLTDWPGIATYLNEHSEIKEVILSGGDPLVLKDKPLQILVEKIAAIKHIKRLRIHTRLPIVLPERITTELITALLATRLIPVIVVHTNHANEIDNEVVATFQKLRQANITLLNQSVLLKDVNDSVSALVNLSETLFSAGVLPYYLHLLDKVQGAAHFDVAEDTAKKLIWEMMQQLPGYLVPKLIREQAGAPAKTPIAIL